MSASDAPTQQAPVSPLSDRDASPSDERPLFQRLGRGNQVVAAAIAVVAITVIGYMIEKNTASKPNPPAAAARVALVPAAADEVSAGVAHLFSQYASGFQALAGKATAFHEQFVLTLKSGASAYTSTEAASTSFLQPVINAIGSVLNQLEPGRGTIFEQRPINFALGLLYIPVELLGLLVLLPFLPFILVLAVA
jgi:PE family